MWRGQTVSIHMAVAVAVMGVVVDVGNHTETLYYNITYVHQRTHGLRGSAITVATAVTEGTTGSKLAHER